MAISGDFHMATDSFEPMSPDHRYAATLDAGDTGASEHEGSLCAGAVA